MPLPFRQKTLGQVRQDIGYLVHGSPQFVPGVVINSSSPTSLVSEVARLRSTNEYVGARIYFTSGLNAGLLRSITAQDASTLIISLNASLPNLPQAGDTFEVWPEDTDPTTINNNIILAIERASDIVQIYTEANPTAIDSTYMIMTLPATFTKVAQAYYFENGLQYDLSPASWQDSQSYASYLIRGNKLILNRALSSTVGIGNIWIGGYRLPAVPASDADLLEVRPDYLTFVGAAYTDMGKAEGQSLDPEQHGGRAAQWMKEAIAIEPRMITNWLPNTQEVLL